MSPDHGLRTTLPAPKNHEGPCCPACMKIAAALGATGESDPMYSGSIRCCCHAEMKDENA